ncbi:MAG: hypothetical protein ACYCXW_23645 [Solirubrobacteraceae bacterium]
MTEPPTPRLNPAALLGTFLRHGVEFVAVGGFAALLYGAERATNDIDLCVAWSRENLERVAAALRELDAQLKIGSYVQVPIDASLLARMEVATWRTDSGDVDILLGIPRTEAWELARYEELRARGTAMEIGELTIVIATLDDIIRSKEIADRPADRVALPELRRLRDRQST